MTRYYGDLRMFDDLDNTALIRMKVTHLELVLALLELLGSTLELLSWFLLFSAPGSSILITFFSFSSLLVEVQDLLIFRTGLALLLPAEMLTNILNKIKFKLLFSMIKQDL